MWIVNININLYLFVFGGRQHISLNELTDVGE